MTPSRALPDPTRRGLLDWFVDWIVLGVLTAVVGASGALGRLANPNRPEQTQDYRLSLSGLTSRGDGTGDEHLHWLHRDDLAVGDRVAIEIVDTTHASIPAERDPAR